MKESIGGTWLFQIAIVFIVLFAGYLALSVNYSKAFKVKNEILSIIEKDEGLSEKAKDDIVAYLRENNHSVYGKCDADDTPYIMQDGQGRKALYCIKKTCPNRTNFDKAYYKVTVFFRLDLPYLGDLFTFKVQGETKLIPYPAEGTEGCS